MNQEKVWTIDDYIAFAESIPEEKWIVGGFTDGFGNCCFWGHLGARGFEDVRKFLDSEHALLNIGNEISVVMVNDSGYSHYGKYCYKQPTPKQRILALLRDLKAKESAT